MLLIWYNCARGMFHSSRAPTVVRTDSYTHSLSPSRPPNNTLNTQSSAQQTHSRSRSLRAHPRRAEPHSGMPRAAPLGRVDSIVYCSHKDATISRISRPQILHCNRCADRRSKASCNQ
eukprot:scaffold38799_cov71-Phaeocystis_antarctica.AAC.1